MDVGILDFPGAPGVWDRRIRNGTADIAQGPAMRREDCVRALLAGAQVAAEGKARGASILAAGEMGIGNTTTTAAVGLRAARRAARRPGWAGARPLGRGAAPQARGRAGSAGRQPPGSQGPGGRPWQGGRAGHRGPVRASTWLRGRARPVLLDGAISAAAALCAVRLSRRRAARCWPATSPPSPWAGPLLEALGLEPAAGRGAAAGRGQRRGRALPLLDMALAVYHGGQTFGRLGIDAYTPQ